MNKKQRKVHGLLGRIQFVDLAKAVAVPMPKRKDFLRTYLLGSMGGARFPSYEHFRRNVPEIYGVIRALDPSPPLTLEEIRQQLRKACHPEDVDRNLDAAEALFRFVRNRGYVCYDHPAHDLPFGPTRKAQIRINHFVVDGSRGVFQFVYPRREALVGNEIALMGSLIHHNYVEGDFEGSAVEIVDLSCPDWFGPRGGRHSGSGQRSPRIHTIDEADIVSRADLAPEVQSVHDLLLEIGDEPDV